MAKITLDEVNGMGREEFVARFGSLYEHSPWVAEAAAEERPFGSADGMHEAFESAVQSAPQESRVELIKAHPDLAGKAAMAGGLTPESASEQSSAGLDRLTPEEYATFKQMNDAYREKFGLPMVVFVRAHTKDSILESARSRLDNTKEEEVESALREIAKITRFRLDNAVEDSMVKAEEPEKGEEQ
ncbi:2-oxo-4-hydroxy-4-carboxy-5-ureidoimidazoline decarboxylase [Rubrobacter aplysinae]|uniref:2-oxo-4-hydroxy-4-carboxy-5-ureidoimidazoline decarboxylase n=1 Tax=Rubrobacter aplysinae TaxID=909625 RepID=UPI00064B9FF7|nr:2-oxo-4-hydroxy-4-carboxy-5-ureidoimidazoline decarboxylase [Rubrobacter aplysinae]